MLGYKKIDILLGKDTGKVYYYEQENYYSQRKKSSVKLNIATGEIGVSV